jgi:hypothetical protein
MQLVEVNYEYHATEMNEEFVIEKLKCWEINSLDMCKGRIKCEEKEF